MNLQRFKMRSIRLNLQLICGLWFLMAVFNVCTAHCVSCYGFQHAAEDFQPMRRSVLDSNQIAEGWLALFDGETTYGWRENSRIDWKVEDKSLAATTGEIGLIRTAAQFDDFELRLEFEAAQDTNSGVFIRTSPSPSDPALDCFEINIAPASNPHPTGSIVGHAKSDTSIRKKGWNSMKIIASGPEIKVWINDSLTTNFQAPKPYLGKGYVGFQHNRGAVKFRNVIIKPLNLNELFDGKSLDGWNDSNKRESKFVVNEDSELKMTGGNGQLESKARFGNFIFSTHIKTNAAGLNSGVFFRCIPGELMNGYESQIQNDFNSNDPTKPVDCGTGGIFRRQDARFVNAHDKKWFAKTIIADGATICVWVNGLQVTDWSDKRIPHLNPRKGYRPDAGSIMLQGHDPTTDVSFRTMFAREINLRRVN